MIRVTIWRSPTLAVKAVTASLQRASDGIFAEGCAPRSARALSWVRRLSMG